MKKLSITALVATLTVWTSSVFIGVALDSTCMGAPASAGITTCSRADAAELSEALVKTFVTSADKRNVEGAALKWQQKANASAATIVVNPDKKFQEILGFGGAFTDATCYVFNELPADSRAKLFDTLFNKSKMGLSVCRTCMGSSDYSTHVYSYDEGKDPDPDLKRFSVDEDRKYILPMLREARKINPDLFLFSSPWSPPGWMKSNGSMLGGAMRRHYMPAYANYFARFLKDYAADGVPINAVTIQNEVDTDQDGNMPACIWPQEYEVDFVRGNLGPLFKKDGINTQIWIIDHNYNLWGRALGSLETPELRKYATAIAWHGYVGDPSSMSKVHDAYPDIDMYWTEGGPDYTDKKYGTNWTTWSKTFTGNLRNWCRSITVWNLALDEVGKPNIGPFPCGGLVTINSKTKDISYSGQYWALSQFSNYVHRGARRIDSQSSMNDVDHVAFTNPDGQTVLVLTNPGPAKQVSVQCGAKSLNNVALEPDSVTTCVW